ncbi:MAG: hypothetical protein ACYCYR_07250 [Desulfobulbaceae bacterium]
MEAKNEMEKRGGAFPEEIFFFIPASKPPDEKNIAPENAGRKRTIISYQKFLFHGIGQIVAGKLFHSSSSPECSKSTATLNPGLGVVFTPGNQ